MIHIFIINPYAGNQHFTNDLRKKLEQYKEIKYFIFHTRHAGDESELVKRVLRFFDDEKLRIYCCGGSGTIKNVINGIDNLNKVEIAFFPCGLSNSFICSFGEKNLEAFYSIEKQIAGSAVPIDYIKTNNGVSLNSMSVGYDQSIIEKVDKFRNLSILGKRIPYFLGLFHGIMLTRPSSFEVKYDDGEYSGKCAQIIFANGYSLGGMQLDTRAKVSDGLGSYYICPDLGFWGMNKLFRHLISKKFNRNSDFVKIGESSAFTIRRKDSKAFQIDLDGELQMSCLEWRAEIVHKGLNFVLPEGVTLDEQ